MLGCVADDSDDSDDSDAESAGSETRDGWSWDPTLYGGSAAHYAVGRVAYPAAVADTLVEAVPLDGSGRLLDVGCGPGSLTLLLAPHVAEAVGVDADPDMLTEAAQLAARQHVRNVTWRHLRGEDLPADLGTFRLVSFAQSFHWMDRPRVAGVVRQMLDRGGALVHVHATTHQGVPGRSRAAVPATAEERHRGVGPASPRGPSTSRARVAAVRDPG